MSSRDRAFSDRALATPRAAAAAGIVFGALLSISIISIRLAVPTSPTQSNFWVSDTSRRNTVVVALSLVPFAGIAFLWFIGVLRDRMGQREDRFFATIFFGSGVLFLAMLFVYAALVGGLLASSAAASSTPLQVDVWQFVRRVTYTIITTYAMRMAAVFTIATATIGMRLTLMPRWMSLSGYGIAGVMLIVVGTVPFVELLFPLWILTVSCYTLFARRTRETISASTRMPDA